MELKTVPNPTASVIEQALALLVSIGGDKKNIQFLEESKSVAQHNEKVFTDTVKDLEILSAARQSFEVEKSRYNRELEEQRQKILKDANDLLEKKQAFAVDRQQAQNQINNDRNTLNAKFGDLEHLRVDLSNRESRLQDDINRFNIERDKFGQRVSEIQTREARLTEREEQLRKFLSP